jgi:hypothetical protein
MQAVVDSPGWAEQVARNPRARDQLLAQAPDRFIETMQRWASFFIPSDTSPVPGMSPADFKRLRMPVLLFRNGRSDLAHTRRTSEWAHELIAHSVMREPPWPDTEWNDRSTAAVTAGRGLFEGWPAMAPAILEFTGER